MLEAKIVDLQMQPLKGGGSLKLTEAQMTKAGLETVDGGVKDHFFVVVTDEPDGQGYHNFLTQRVQVDPKNNLHVAGTPRLALTVPEIREGRLYFVFDGKDEVEVPQEYDPAQILPVQVWEYRGGALEVPILSEFMSDSLARRVRVAATAGPWNRMSRQNFMLNNNPLRAQDGYPVHPVSLDDARAIFGALGQETDATRFRYQVLLEGLPFRAMHNYEVVDVNGVTVYQPKPGDRCEVTGIDQVKGEFSPIKPLAGLAKLNAGFWMRPDRPEGKNKVQIMGENWLPQGETIIRIGDTVRFTQERRVPLRFETPKSRAN